MKKFLSVLVFCLSTFTVVYGQMISPYLTGQNAWLPKGYGGVTYNGELDELWPLVKESKVQMVRIGGNGVEFNMPSGDEYLALIDSIRSIGAEPMVQVSNGRGKYAAAQAANIVDYVNNVKQRNIKYWIIGNEPNLVSTAHPDIVDAAGVAAYIKEWSSAMKAIDPSILIIGPECSFYDSNYYPALVGGAHDITGKDANGRYYIDIISFHTYPFNGTQTRAQVTASAQGLASNVDNLIQLMNNANALHNRTGSSALQWALTEFNIGFKNPTSNTVEGVGAHSFLNGQYWAEVFNVGMQKQAVSVMPWSIHESSGNRTDLDLGYLDGTGFNIKPRSAYYHEMLIAENFKGTYLPATHNQSLITAFGSVHNDTTSVMLINKSLTDNFDYTLQLSNTAITDASPLKINLLSNINKEFKDKLFNQSTLVLLFDAQGNLLKKIVYSLQHAVQTIPPSYLSPGESSALVNFSADKTQACVDQDQDLIVFKSSIHGSYASLTWHFGERAVPETASGEGPFTVKYSTAGNKNVSLTLEDTDTTIVVNKEGYIKAISCIRSPYAATVIPGVLKAINYDNGGEGAAFHDTDEINRGAVANPNVPRADEAVDTDTGTPGGNIGWTENGEWLKYTVTVQKSGIYRIVGRLASAIGGGSLRLSVNNVDKTGIVSVPKTASWTDYQDVTLGSVSLEAAESATIKIDIVKSAFNIDRFTFTEQDLSGVVVNRIYNATSTVDGMSDAVELLITKDHTDIRGLIIKDFESNLTSDAGGKYQFKENDLWKDLRKGTTIVLRKLASGISGYEQDADTTDFKIDLLFENSTYLANLSSPGHQFNLTNTDMVLLKVGSANGSENAIHALATNNGGGSAFYHAVSSPKLISTTILNTGEFKYPLNPEKSLADFNGAKTGNSTDSNRNWGNGYGTNNIEYISALRGVAIPVTPPTIVVNRVYNGSNDGDGKFDAVELLVIKDRLDIRNLVVKDFESNNTTDNGGKYRFNDNPLWQNLRSGTTIVLRKIAGPAGYIEDTNASDFTLDLLMSNTTYLTNLIPAVHFNITQYDMVVIKTGSSAGVDGVLHAFATKGGGNSSSLLSIVNSYKLISPDGTDAGGGSFHYPLNPSKTLADFNSTNAAISKSTDLNWGYGFGQNNIEYIQSLRNAVTPAVPAIVVNRVYNGSNDPDGKSDAVELLVVKDHLDIRNLVVKDFENNNSTDNGGKYRFNDNPLWQDLRAGTTIVLRKLAGPAGYVEDTDASDFTIDLLLENTIYLTNLSGAIFNITQYDMILIKTGAATGTDGAIHAFATKGGGGSAFLQAINGFTLVSPDGTDAGGGSFHYPLNPTTKLADYNRTNAAISKSTDFNWGYGFGQNNTAYIKSLRDSVIVPPSQLSASVTSINQINLNWTDNSNDETGFEVVRSLDGNIYASIASVPANSASYTDACLNYNTTYYYKVRTKNGVLLSSYSALANATTDSIPGITLATLKGECSITAQVPVVSDNCGGEITGNTTDPVTYTTVGTYVINWIFDDGRGNSRTATQTVIVDDTTAPVALAKNISLTLVNGSATIEAGDIDNRSSDACGIQSLIVDQTRFDCANLGENTVVLTVTDSNGNVSNASAIVNVIGSVPVPVIEVSKSNNTFTGLDNQTIAIGYGAQNVTLVANNNTSGATSYLWSPSSGLSSTTVANPLFTPTAAGSYTFNVIATNEFGCSASASVTITVIDVRGGNNNDKVSVCIKNGTKTISVSNNAVDTHLRKGGSLGTCPSSTQQRIAPVSSSDIALDNNTISAYPNPFVSQATVTFRMITEEDKVSLDLYDLNGFKVLNIYSGPIKAFQKYSFDIDRLNIPTGTYFIRLTTNKTSLDYKVIVLQ